MLNSGIAFISKLTGLSIPFRSSFNPEPLFTKSGAETLVKFKFLAKESSKKSLSSLIATSVSLSDNKGL